MGRCSLLGANGPNYHFVCSHNSLGVLMHLSWLPQKTRYKLFTLILVHLSFFAMDSIILLLITYEPCQVVTYCCFCILHRRCSGCRKKRSLRSNSFFEEFPRVSLGKLLLVTYFFITNTSQRTIARHLGLNPGLISGVCRRLQDVCSRDLHDRPVTPFGGPGAVVKCDESKFNHKPKVMHCCVHSVS